MKSAGFRHVLALFLLILFNAESFSLPVTDKGLFTGASLIYHNRVGYLTFSDGRTDPIGREDMPAFGFLLGKRFAISKIFRLQVPMMVSFGSVSEDSFASFDGIVKAKLLGFELSPELQLPLKVNAINAFYLSVGSGVHVVNFTEQNRDDFVNRFTCSSLSIGAGVGYEKVTSRTAAFSIQYFFRFGRPVYYTYLKDLFPYRGLEYKETFLTHSIRFILLVRNQ